MASPSPVTDGERVIVHFGNGDLAAYSFAGEQIWKRNLQEDHGPYTIWWGHANSPVLHRDLVISACMQDSLADLPGGQSLSYVVAHDKRTGKEVWKTSRMTSAKAEECDSYITPILRRNGNTTEVVLVGGDTLDAYNPATGDRLWHFPNLAKARIITGLCTHADLVFATRGMRGDLFALRPSGLGQLPISDQVWRHAPGTPDTCCPVATNGLLFWVSDNGVARCVDAATGSEHWAQRLGGEFKASPVIAEGRVHFLNTAGKCFVLAAKPNFQRLAENSIDDEMLASPAIVDGQIYLRGKKGLYCIGEK
jgi:outer membrane protein assembly factor BamB